MQRDNAAALELTTPSDREILIVRRFATPPELVFAAWTEPHHVKRWWGPHGFTTTHCEINLRPGGTFRIEMRGPDGEIYATTGTYREVTPPVRLVYEEVFGCLGQPDTVSLVTVTFVEAVGGTTVKLHTRCMSRAHRDALIDIGVEQGWTGSFERLSDYLPQMRNQE